MAKYRLRRLSTKADDLVKITCPVTEEELNERDRLYFALAPKDFAKQHHNFWHKPVEIFYQGKKHAIQMNFCTDPFCKWFGMEQERFTTVPNKPYRYQLHGKTKSDSESFICNPDRLMSSPGIVLNGNARAYSNWSIADEIARLVTANTVVNWEPLINFHKDDCAFIDQNPYDSPKSFYGWGYSISNSPRFKCRECKKVTNVLPNKEECFTYHQKRNDILPTLARLILARSPVKRICTTLGIGNKTYYTKLEWINRCCLEFLERHETGQLKNKQFGSLWLNSDQMIYFLNNVRKKGSLQNETNDSEDLELATNIIATADMYSRYVFRADIGYDWSTTLEDIAADTRQYHEDHLPIYARKNGRCRISYEPQPPTKKDHQTVCEYEFEIAEFANRNKYVDGIHVTPAYTAIAHYWLLHQQLNAKNWRFVTDQDNSLLTAICRVFAQDIADGYAHHFLCKIDHSKSKRSAKSEFARGHQVLKRWASQCHLRYSPDLNRSIAEHLIEEDLKTRDLFVYQDVNGQKWPVGVDREICHPLPTNGSCQDSCRKSSG